MIFIIVLTVVDQTYLVLQQRRLYIVLLLIKALAKINKFVFVAGKISDILR